MRVTKGTVMGGHRGPFVSLVSSFNKSSVYSLVGPA